MRALTYLLALQYDVHHLLHMNSTRGARGLWPETCLLKARLVVLHGGLLPKRNVLKLFRLL